MPRKFALNLRSPHTWQLVLAVYWLVLFTATHMPIQRLAMSQGSTDKLAHLGAFAVLAAILATAWRLAAGQFTRRELLMALMLIMLYATLEELTQPIVGRVASFWDWLADAIGAVVGLVFVYLLPGKWFGNSARQSLNGETNTQSHRTAWISLFAFLTVACMACFWLVLPTIYAQDFARALQQRDFAAANQLFVQESPRFPGNTTNHEYFKPQASIEPASWQDIRQGQRRINVGIRYGNEEESSTTVNIRSTRRGLDLLGEPFAPL